MFDKFRYNGNFNSLLMELVQLLFPHCDHCIVKYHKDGTKTYEHNVLEAKLVFDSFVSSLDSEFIEDPDPSIINLKKQDCNLPCTKKYMAF